MEDRTHQIKAEEFATKEENKGKLSPAQASRIRAKDKRLFGEIVAAPVAADGVGGAPRKELFRLPVPPGSYRRPTPFCRFDNRLPAGGAELPFLTDRRGGAARLRTSPTLSCPPLSLRSAYPGPRRG
jgi:hypothetical protein